MNHLLLYTQCTCPQEFVGIRLEWPRSYVAFVSGLTTQEEHAWHVRATNKVMVHALPVPVPCYP